MRKSMIVAMTMLTFAILSTAASAVTLNPHGLGQVLVFPYFTVNNSHDTSLSVANTSPMVGKIVRVHFMEGYNGRDVLDFNIYLSPLDVWQGIVSSAGGENGGAQLSWTDQSCVDMFSTDPQPFVSANYTGAAGSAFPADSGPQTLARTREGHFEIIALADIDPGSALSVAITHRQTGDPDGGKPDAADGGIPGHCAQIADLTLAALAQGYLHAPSNDLLGSAAIIDVGEGTFYAYTAEALSGFTDHVLIDATGTPPTLAAANSAESTATARAYVTTNSGKTLAIDYDHGIDAVSAVFMADGLYNEYLADATLGANTDWVVTFPTKHFYVDPAYGRDDFSPFELAFEGGSSPTYFLVDIMDREEFRYSTEPCSLLNMLCPFFPYETNVLAFTPLRLSDTVPSPVLGSRLGTSYLPLGNSGWARLQIGGNYYSILAGGRDGNGAETLLNGRPVTGFMVYNVVNANAEPGKLANYSGLFRHRMTLSCLVDENQYSPTACP